MLPTSPETALGYDAPLLPEVFAIHGRMRGNRPAVVAHDGSLTWRELIERTDRLAGGLRALGIQPGDRIGLLISSGVAAIEIMVGILRAGMVAVPINLSVTDETVGVMLADSGAVALIVTAEQRDRVAMIDLPVRIVTGAPSGDGWTGYDDWMRAQSAPAPDVEITADMLAVIIYSSGTTGLPKGIVHSHGTRQAWAADASALLRYHGLCRTILVTGMFSNITWLGMLSTLLHGGTLFVPDHFDVLGFMQMVERERITHVAMVPVQFQRVLDHPEFARFDLSSLQSMMSVGSKLASGLKERVLQAFPGALFDAYGLTEGIVVVHDPEEALVNLNACGRPGPGAEMAVLRDDDSLAKVGEVGELIGRSRFSMVGYWNRPEATAEATWVDERGRRWLRTGDIGTVDAEGQVTLLDRKKDMILSGGQNIYPADIEAILLDHPDVCECAVIGVPSDAWGETPLAVVVPTQPEVDAETIRLWVNERVGKQQRVHAVSFRAELPRNHNGKLLKRELRAEFWS